MGDEYFYVSVLLAYFAKGAKLSLWPIQKLAFECSDLFEATLFNNDMRLLQFDRRYYYDNV